MNIIEHINFHSFIKAIRIEQKVTLEQLSTGLCSISELTRIENGSRLPDKLMRDRLLSRLGISTDRYEDFLPANEFMLWENQRQLLDAVSKHDIPLINLLLSEYEKKANYNKKIEVQFYLAMKVQLYQYQQLSSKKILNLLETALNLTLPNVKEGLWYHLPLATQELNLLLEYIYYDGTIENRVFFSKSNDSYKIYAYELLINKFMTSQSDVYSRVKIYPKAIYYLCKELMAKPECDWNFDKILNLCNSAIEMLCNTTCIHYLYELLTIRYKLISILIIKLQTSNDLNRLDMLRILKNKTSAWLSYLNKTVGENSESKRITNYCYLYYQPHVHCIGTVIHIRRNMIGLTRKQLCSGICDERTLQRLESHQTKAQLEIVLLLFNRLGLFPKYQYRELISNKYDMFLLYDNIINAMNHLNFQHALTLIEQLENNIYLEISSNRQLILFFKALCQYYSGKISVENLVAQLVEALECTITLKSLKNKGRKYLSHMESNCLCSIITHLEKASSTSFQMFQRIYVDYCNEFILP